MLKNEYLLANFGVDTEENERFNFDNFSSLQGFNFDRPPAPGRRKNDPLSLESFIFI